jgi:hypothetical protein
MSRLVCAFVHVKRLTVYIDLVGPSWHSARGVAAQARPGAFKGGDIDG